MGPCPLGCIVLLMEEIAPPLCVPPGNEHPLPAPYSHPKSRVWIPKALPFERPRILRECRSCALCLIPQNKQDFFFPLFFFFSLSSSPFFPLSFSTPPEPLLLVAGSPDSVGTQKCRRSKPRLPSRFRNPLEAGGETRNKMGGDLLLGFFFPLY